MTTFSSSDTSAAKATYLVDSAKVIKASPGRVARVSVTFTPNGAVGVAIHDAATIDGASPRNLIAVLPPVIGVYELDWPCATGIVVMPNRLAVAVSWR